MFYGPPSILAIDSGFLFFVHIPQKEFQQTMCNLWTFLDALERAGLRWEKDSGTQLVWNPVCFYMTRCVPAKEIKTC